MRKINLKVNAKPLLVIVFVLCAALTKAKTKPAKLELDVNMQENSVGLPNAWLTVIAYGTSIDTVMVEPDTKGRVKWALDADKLYTVIFSKPGYVSKRIKVSTKGMHKDAAKNYYYPVAINLFKEKKALDITVLKKSIDKIYFDKEKNNFNDDAVYAKTIVHELEKLQKELEK